MTWEGGGVILFRWTSTMAARQAIEADVMTPSWEHLLPGGPVQGICLGLHPLRWADACEQRSLMLVLECPELEDHPSAFRLHGDTAFGQTGNWRAAVEAVDPVRAAALEAAAGAALASPGEEDEVFLAAPLEGIRARVRAAVWVELEESPEDADAACLKAWCRESNLPWVELWPVDLRDIHHEVERLSLLAYLSEQLPGLVRHPDKAAAPTR